jgi:phenylpropionate dioxygenase-like ring-hydroxylating dioxygenase large terminal subunit
MHDALERGRIPLDIYGDPDIFELELDRIFSRNWLLAAHESEIPAPGDYVVRPIAGGRWIVARDGEGIVRVLFDSCRHRGTELCRTDKGKASVFTCPYHGWTYKNDGTLIGVPNREAGYRDFDEREWGLLHAPRVEVYRGLIMVNLDADAPSFRDHLGDFRWYFDQNFGAAGGMEVVGDPNRWIMPANWKSPADNFAGDSTHTRFLHRSITEVGMLATFAGTTNDVHVTECNGHSMSLRRAGPGQDSFWGYPPALYDQFRNAGLDAHQVELARSAINTASNVFPSLSFFHGNLTNDPDQPGCAVFNLQQWQPRSAGETEVWTWILVPKAASPEYKERAYQVAQSNFGPAGNIGNDDNSIFSGIQRSAACRFVRNGRTMLNYEMGLHLQEKVIPDWPGPGIVYGSRLEDGAQRTFYRHWLNEMTRL